MNKQKPHFELNFMINPSRNPAFLITLLISLWGITSVSHAQPGIEPQVRGIDVIRTPLDEGFRNGASFNVLLNNFGFGISGDYRRMLGPLTEGFVEFQITPLRDVTEQNYQFFGQQIIPNKRNRVVSFPLTAGFKQRLFAGPVSDNFRFFTSAQAGPTMAFVYPYYNLREVYYMSLDDLNTFGLDPSLIKLGRIEANTGQFVNDTFQGWGDGSWVFGVAGQLSIGVDFSESYKNITSVKVGFSFNYFDDGIQVMDPFRSLGVIPPTDTTPTINVVEPAADKQKFFGSPFFTISVGGMW
jgi:hypothetical protein